jgi:hypothetical protein
MCLERPRCRCSSTCPRLFWCPNKIIFAKEHAYIGGDGMGRFRLPSVGTLEGRVRGDRDRALLTALLRADALSIGRVLQLPGLFRPPVRA